VTRRVAVTGMGVISALGCGREAFWKGLTEGRSGIRPMTLVAEGSLKFRNGAEVPNYNPSEYFDEKEHGFLDRFAQFAAIAAREAVRDAGLEFSGGLCERTAIVTGSCVGGKATEDQGFHDLYKLGVSRFPPLSIPKAMANAGASRISLEFGITGPVYTVSTACSSANHAIGQAFWMVQNGTAEIALAGGSEAPFTLGMLKAWEALRVVSPETCRPFSLGRQGMILGEGAGILVLEPLERAVARGAHVWGRHRAQFRGLHQRSRNRYRAKRPHRSGCDPRCVRRACGSAAGQLDEVDAWSCAGRGGGSRSRGDSDGAARGSHSADR
jgi:nodulation protein E